MIAIINLPNSKEIIYDLNCQIFNVIEPKCLAKIYWDELEEMINGGIDEHTAYTYMNEYLQEYINKGEYCVR